MQERLRSEIKKIAVIFSILLFYYLFVRVTGIRIPCVFYEITGLLCPGCGITRMMMSVAKLDFATAYSYNKFVFATAPILLLAICVCEVAYIRTGSRKVKAINLFAWIYIAALILFTIVRNIV